MGDQGGPLLVSTTFKIVKQIFEKKTIYSRSLSSMTDM